MENMPAARGAIRIAVSRKAFERDTTGGNTSYLRNLYPALAGLNVDAQLLQAPGRRRSGVVRALSYAAAEGVVWPRSVASDDADLLHFPADTGGLTRGRVPIVATVHGVEGPTVPG